MKTAEKDLKEEKITREKFDNISTEKSSEICYFAGLIGVSIATVATLINELIVFIMGLALGEFFIFLSISPFAIGIMACVSSNLRGQSNAVSLFFSYALGGFPAPTVIGGIFEVSDQKWGMVMATGWLFWSFFFWWLAWLISRNHRGPHGYHWKFWKKDGKSQEEYSKTSVNADLLPDELKC